MASVSALVEIISESGGLDYSVVSRIARSLINAGVLPKAKGRAVPHVTAEQSAKLLLAVAGTDRPSEAFSVLQDLWNLKEPSEDVKGSAGEVLTEEITGLAAMSYDRWQIWQYSKLEVSRGYPSIKFRINENIADFANYRSEQPVFVPSINEPKKDNRGRIHIACVIDGDLICKIAAAVAGKTYIEAILETKERQKEIESQSKTY